MHDSLLLVIFLSFLVFILICWLIWSAVSLPKRKFEKQYRNYLDALIQIPVVLHVIQVDSKDSFNQFDPDSIMKQLAANQTLESDTDLIKDRISQLKELNGKFHKELQQDILDEKFSKKKKEEWEHLCNERILAVSALHIAWFYKNGEQSFGNRRLYPIEEINHFRAQTA